MLMCWSFYKVITVTKTIQFQMNIIIPFQMYYNSVQIVVIHFQSTIVNSYNVKWLKIKWKSLVQISLAEEPNRLQWSFPSEREKLFIHKNKTQERPPDTQINPGSSTCSGDVHILHHRIRIDDPDSSLCWHKLSSYSSCCLSLNGVM